MMRKREARAMGSRGQRAKSQASCGESEQDGHYAEEGGQSFLVEYEGVKMMERDTLWMLML